MKGELKRQIRLATTPERLRSGTTVAMLGARYFSHEPEIGDMPPRGGACKPADEEAVPGEAFHGGYDVVAKSLFSSFLRRSPTYPQCNKSIPLLGEEPRPDRCFSSQNGLRC